MRWLGAVPDGYEMMTLDEILESWVFPQVLSGGSGPSAELRGAPLFGASISNELLGSRLPTEQDAFDTLGLKLWFARIGL